MYNVHGDCVKLTVYMQRWKTTDVHNSLESMYVLYARNGAMGLRLRSIDGRRPRRSPPVMLATHYYPTQLTLHSSLQRYHCCRFLPLAGIHAAEVKDVGANTISCMFCHPSTNERQSTVVAYVVLRINYSLDETRQAGNDQAARAATDLLLRLAT